MIEAIERIKKAEELAEQTKKKAMEEANQIESDAHVNGKKFVEEAKKKALEKAENMIKEANKQATDFLKQKSDYTEADSKKVEEEATKRIGKAADFIKERIVELQ